MNPQILQIWSVTHRPYKTYLENMLSRGKKSISIIPNQSEVHSEESDSPSETEHSVQNDQNPETAEETDIEPGPVSSDDDSKASSLKTEVTPKQTRPKRSVKPIIQLPYDEPGKARDQPLTIVHRGVVFKIGKS